MRAQVLCCLLLSPLIFESDRVINRIAGRPWSTVERDRRFDDKRDTCYPLKQWDFPFRISVGCQQWRHDRTISVTLPDEIRESSERSLRRCLSLSVATQPSALFFSREPLQKKSRSCGPRDVAIGRYGDWSRRQAWIGPSRLPRSL